MVRDGRANRASRSPGGRGGLSDKGNVMWINLSAISKIVVYGLIAGAGLPALFAVGLYSLSRGGRTRTVGADSDVLVGGSLAGKVVAALCFLTVLAAVGWGIYEIYQIGHPSK